MQGWAKQACQLHRRCSRQAGSPGRRRCAGSGDKTRGQRATRCAPGRRMWGSGLHAAQCRRRQARCTVHAGCKPPARSHRSTLMPHHCTPTPLQHKHLSTARPPHRCTLMAQGAPTHLRNCWLLEVLGLTRWASRSRCRPAGRRAGNNCSEPRGRGVGTGHSRVHGTLRGSMHAQCKTSAATGCRPAQSVAGPKRPLTQATSAVHTHPPSAGWFPGPSRTGCPE